MAGKWTTRTAQEIVTATFGKDAWRPTLHSRIAAALEEARREGLVEAARPSDESTYGYAYRDGYVDARQSILSRLQNPDEAMIEAVARAWLDTTVLSSSTDAARALLYEAAAVLAAESETPGDANGT